MDQNQSITNPEITNMYNSFNSMLMNPSAIIILVIVVIIYVLLFSTLGGTMENGSSSFSSSYSNDSSANSSSGSGSAPNIMFVIIVVIFIILIAINGIQYFFGTDIVATVKNFFTETPEIDITVNNPAQKDTPVPEITVEKQVFNIPGNNYVYPDAKALCSAYGSRLATYQEIEESYNKGGEWCNYGWSDGQMALFPTQQSTYDGLQKIPEHENDCGRPGINGGYMANPALKFGVNCYGYKPTMTAQEEELMQTQPHYPVTVKDIEMEKRVNYWKNKLNEILVSPFNYKNWSKV